MLTGSDSAPAKANEAKQANDIGTVKDEISIAVQNAQMEAYDDVYVNNASTTKKGDVSTTVGSKVIAKLRNGYQENQENIEKHGVKITIASSGIITLETTDKTEYGQINLNGGALKWTGTTLPTTNDNDENEENNTPEPLEIGTPVSYSTTLNGQPLSNWKVFYNEKIDGTNYTYLIYGNYLPNSAVDTENIEGIGTSNYNMYNVVPNGENIAFNNAMKTGSNWNSLLAGNLNGVNIDYRNSQDTNIYAMGTPTLDLWINSWNTVYPSKRLYVKYYYDDENEGALYDYSIGTSSNPDSDNIRLDNTSTLFFAYTDETDSCYGYGLALPNSSTSFTVECEDESYAGYIGKNYYDADSYFYSIRPVIKLPTSVVNQ